MKKIKRWRLFFNLMISYLVILTGTLGAGAYVYAGTVKIIKNDTMQSAAAILEQSKNALEKRINELENMAVSLSMDPRIMAFFDAGQPLSGSQYYSMQELVSRLYSYKVPNNFLEQVYVYYKNSDLVISSDYATSRENAFSQSLVSMNSQADSAMMEYLKEQHSGMVRLARGIADKNTYNLAYIKSIPIGSSTPKGAIIFLIRENEIRSILSGLNIKDQGFCYIEDSRAGIITGINADNQILSALPDKPWDGKDWYEANINGEKTMVTHATSLYNGWKYVYGIKSNTLMAKVIQINRGYVVSTVLVFLLGLLVAAFLLYWNLKPFRRLVKAVLGKTSGCVISEASGASEVELIEGTIDNLFRNNRQLNEALENQLPLLKAGFIERLLHGEFYKPGELQAVMNYSGITLSGRWYAAILIQIYKYSIHMNGDVLQDLDMVRLTLQKELEKIIKNEGIIHTVDSDKLVIVIGLNASGSEEMRNMVEERLHKVSPTMYEKTRIGISMAVGGFCGNLSEISRSYEQAKLALSFPAQTNHSILWADDLPRGVSEYDYSIEVESRLINLTKAGEIQEAQLLLKTVIAENCVHRSLSPVMIRQLHSDMLGTLLKIKQQIALNQSDQEEITGMIGGLYGMVSQKRFLDNLNNIIVRICQCVDKNRRSHNHILKKRMIEFIDSNYHSANLSLSAIASEFGVTEKYVCEFFKEQTGENYSVYLEKVRLGQAVNLLKNSGKSVKDITAECGYASLNTFYKAFKRVYKVSPSEYQSRIIT